MSNLIAIVGESGTGKSTSIMNPIEGMIGLDPKETFIFNVMGKPLPFRGAMKHYNPDKMPSDGGNYFETLDYKTMYEILTYINTSRPDIKNIVLDDSQYTIANEFMEKANKAGYQKFTEMASNYYKLLMLAKDMRRDINFFVLTHPEYDEKRQSYQAKTAGKLLAEKINILGLFSIALFTEVKTMGGKTEYNFITNTKVDNLGNTVPAKSPPGMFEELLIPNDLGLVVQKVHAYYNE